MRKKFLVIIVGLILLAIAGEILLRLVWGLGSPPLLVADTDIGYLFAPNQNLVRFGNQVKINRFSQRSDDPVTPKPEGSIRILLVGDSIAFGGVLTDQHDTISALMDDLLAGSSGHATQTLNASAGSWGVENALAYLERYGLFEADVLVLLLNTNDLCQSKSSGHVVGHLPDYPDKKPLLAYAEAIERYVPRYLPDVLTPPQPDPVQKVTLSCDQNFSTNMEALRQSIDLAASEEIPFVVVLNPLRCEIDGETTPCTPDGRQQFLDEWDHLTTNHDKDNLSRVKLVDMLPIYNQLYHSGFDTSSLWRDRIHPDQKGNRVIAAAITSVIHESFMLE
jgi:lysophospholipase L1-like esterase